ncbi:hypothetical protein [Sulfuricurvum sp.]|uniref:hypothetical protein n=1 Tax=Sulfuricurvum sp. TaxID=2025608 RepID=UPI002621A18C|nr:hypothetical protein [Sulfuricurvum sp.]MDD3596677.1 hypothetical protein [Sulfuricurvum sp.]
MGTDAGTLYVCAESIEEAHSIVNESLDSSVTYVGELSEKIGNKYWPSETYGILGESDGLLFPVDEAAEEAEQAAAEAAWQNEQMDKLLNEESEQDVMDVAPQKNETELKNIAVQFEDELLMFYTPSIERAREVMLHSFANGKIDEPQDIYEIPDADMQFHSFDGHVWDTGKELDWNKVQIASIASIASENKSLKDVLASLNSNNQTLQIK